MASFCGDCVSELFELPTWRNDFALSDREVIAAGITLDDPWRWRLCEGCGQHLIDANGRRACGWGPRFLAYDEICVSCLATEGPIAESAEAEEASAFACGTDGVAADRTLDHQAAVDGAGSARR